MVPLHNFSLIHSTEPSAQFPGTTLPHRYHFTGPHPLIAGLILLVCLTPSALRPATLTLNASTYVGGSWDGGSAGVWGSPQSVLGAGEGTYTFGQSGDLGTWSVENSALEGLIINSITAYVRWQAERTGSTLEFDYSRDGSTNGELATDTVFSSTAALIYQTDNLTLQLDGDWTADELNRLRFALRNTTSGGSPSTRDVAVDHVYFVVDYTPTALGNNLVKNPGAESGAGAASPPVTSNIPHFTQTAGNIFAGLYNSSIGLSGTCANCPPTPGNNFFLGSNALTSTAHQRIDLRNLDASIDAGLIQADLSAYLGGRLDQWDSAALTAVFEDSAFSPLSSLVIGPITPAERGGATDYVPPASTAASTLVPALTRYIRLEVKVNYASGSMSDGYVDDITLMLSQASPACSPFSCQGFATAGDAQNLGASQRLTDAQAGQTGAVWAVQQVDLSADFDQSFEIFLGNDPSGGEGAAFVLHNDPRGIATLGQGGMFLGYGGASAVSPSVAVEVDTFSNAGIGDLAQHHVAVNEHGTVTHNGAGPICATADATSILDGQTHRLRLVWTVTATRLDVYFDGSLRLSYTKDIINQVFGGVSCVYWGFTGATGSAASNRQVLRHLNCLSPSPAPDLCAATWTVNGSASGSPGGGITLTAAVNTQAGSAFADTPIDLLAPFDYSFLLNFGSNAGGADGMAFVLHNDPRGATAMGGVGGSLGYGGVGAIIPSLADAMYTFNPTNTSQIEQDGTATAEGCTDATTCPYAFGFSLADGADHIFRATWDPIYYELRLYFDSVLIHTYTRNLVDLAFDGENLAYLGFSAATGGLNNRHWFMPQCAPQPTATPTFTASPALTATLTSTPTPNGTPLACAPASCGGWLVRGSAVLLDGGFRLTADANQAGAVWADQWLDLTADFDLSYDLFLGDVNAGGEGMAFVLHTDPRGADALGDVGPALGFGDCGSGARIAPSLAVEVDTVQQASEGDPAWSHVAVNENGALNHNGAGPAAALASQASLADGRAHRLRLTWNAASTRLDVFIDGDLRLSYTKNVINALFGGISCVYTGLTGSSGGQAVSLYARPRNCLTPMPTPDWCASTWTLNGNAAGGVPAGITLTANASGQVGSAFHNSCLDLAFDFDVAFRINFASDVDPADGMTLVFHSDPRGLTALGGGGGNIGYGGSSTKITPSFAATFYIFGSPDTLQMEEQGSTNGGGCAYAAPCPVSYGSSLNNGIDKILRAVWSVDQQRLEIFLDGVLQTAYTRDLIAVLKGTRCALVGLTAAAGSSASQHWFNPECDLIPFTATVSPTDTASPTASPSHTDSPTPDSSSTATPTQTPSATQSYTLTGTPTVTETVTLSPTPSHTTTGTATGTATGTNTPTATATHTGTNTRTMTPTDTPSATATHSPSPTVSISSSPTGSFTITNTNTPTATSTATQTHTPTATSTYTPTVTETITKTHSPTATPTATPTWTPTATPTDTPTVTPTFTPSETPSPTPSDTSTTTPTFTYTATPTNTHTWTPTFTPTWTPTITPTATPSASPTPTATSTDTPTATLTFTPSATQTATPTWTPSSTPTATPTWTTTASPTTTSTWTPTVTDTATPGASPTPTATPTDTPTATPTFTLSATQTTTPTWTPTDTATATPTNSPTVTETATASASPTPTATPTTTATHTGSPSPSNTPTPTPTTTSSATESATQTWSPSTTVTYTATPSATQSATSTPTTTYTPTNTPSRTATASPSGTTTGTATGTITLTHSPTSTSTSTATLTFTPTFSGTNTYTETYTSTTTSTQTPPNTATGTFTSTHTPTLTGTPTLTPSFTHSPTISPTFTTSQTFTQTPVISWIITIDIFNPSGIKVRSLAGGGAAEPILSMHFSSEPFDPNQGPLVISSKTWSTGFDGFDNQGDQLGNGVYTVVIKSNNGSGTLKQAISQISLVRTGQELVSGFKGAPNPVLPTHTKVWITWDLVPDVEVRVYNNAGELIRMLGTVQAPSNGIWWDMTSSDGKPVSNGIYHLTARLPGQRKAALFKLAISH